MSKREFAMLTESVSAVREGKFVREQQVRGPVRVMCRAEGYAMVRFKGAMPFVVDSLALSPVPAAAPQEQPR